MLAAVFEGRGKIVMKEVREPAIKRPDEVLLEVEAASICGTDLKILAVPPGHPASEGVILGHEYIGRVIEIGSAVTQVKRGDRVAVCPDIPCGHCAYCRMSFSNLCEQKTTLGIFVDGGFAKYNVAPMRALYKISPVIPAACAVLAEPLSAVVNATQILKPHVGESVVILGAGPIGLLFTQMFKANGAGKIIVSEVLERRCQCAKISGATTVVDPSRVDLRKATKKETPLGADIVVDAVGSLFKESIEIVRRGGKVLLFGQNANAISDITQNDITHKELRIMGSYAARYTFPLAIQILNSGVLHLDQLISHQIPLKDLKKWIKTRREGKAIKVVIIP